MKVLVTGATGYIGQHVVAACLRAGHDVDGPKKWQFLPLFFGNWPCEYDAIVHLAALIDVAESIREPARYLDINLGNSLSLLRWATKASPIPPRFIFASSAAAGMMTAEVQHESPYALSKYGVELAMRWIRLPGVALRFFNVAGGEFPENHDPETHLIPRLIDAAFAQEAIDVYGTDWPTPDGTCIRDYVNAKDVARACVQALELESYFEPIDIGSGRGHSVRDVVQAVEAALGSEVPPTVMVDQPRRKGDVAELIADTTRAKLLLDWTPENSTLTQIVQEAVSLRRTRP